MKALFAAVATAASLAAGFGVNVDSQSTTPAVETLVARNELNVPPGYPNAAIVPVKFECIFLCKDKLVIDKMTKVVKGQ